MGITTYPAVICTAPVHGETCSRNTAEIARARIGQRFQQMVESNAVAPRVEHALKGLFSQEYLEIRPKVFSPATQSFVSMHSARDAEGVLNPRMRIWGEIDEAHETVNMEVRRRFPVPIDSGICRISMKLTYKSSTRLQEDKNYFELSVELANGQKLNRSISRSKNGRYYWKHLSGKNHPDEIEALVVVSRALRLNFAKLVGNGRCDERFVTQLQNMMFEKSTQVTEPCSGAIRVSRCCE